MILIDNTNPSEAGGKGASLARLAKHGFNPPASFVISADAFVDGKPARGLKTAVHKALKGVGAGPYAVRSSGQAEDGEDHSHAGQFDTFLNVKAADVVDAASKVWASGFGETVTTYRAVKSGGEAQAPAIVVQQMIAARISGIAFSADPVSGRRNCVVISAVEGLGDALVSGEVDGQSWIVGDAVSAPEDPILTDAEVQEVANLARSAEAAFGAPQDIEWAIDADGLHILQARPITTKLKTLATTDNTLTIYDNSNIVESYPGIVSPLTYSFAVHVYDRVYQAFVRLLGVKEATIAANSAVFGNMLGRVDGRVYYNLVNWYRALALLPGFSLNRAYMETMMGVDTPMPEEVTSKIGPPPAMGTAKALEYGRLVKVAGRLLFEAIRLPRTRRSFYERLNAALDSELDLAAANPTELAAEYRRIESTLLDRWDAPLVNDFLCMIAFGASRNLLKKWLGDDGLTLHNDVMIGQGDIVSAEPAQRIAKMGAIAAKYGIDADDFATHPQMKPELESYLAKFGDRCTEELKLESIPLTEDPSQLLSAIAASAGRPATTHESAPDPDWNALFKGRPIKAQVARWSVGWAKARVRDRENLRFERTRLFGRARQVFLAMGREFAARDLLENPRDIFHLTVAEALGAIEGYGLSPNLRGIVALRQSEDKASASREDPPERIEVRGPAIVPATTQHDETVETETGDSRTATGCSAGVVTAKARVIRDPRTESLTPGDILVARHTDPGWIAVFSNASAIVVERGSLLSHSAIVARELGIPCVVGLKGATKWVEDGETLHVNGATGLVEKRDAKL
ncbi:pyruvate, water dikinase [Cognatiyoonia koreensis]|uniref:Pyruvate, water dikinase n=1 Tax=Cognatiyoonia koreensis TaxID=364200 RepID=A0A1I0PW49_9RHOB|nr:PEP/pyruvate-binding domain-containing protein [Cognatiyoonia koreensis]SEW18603.1 pyruvate, water dikinase [Cognatiyoonia koreensis]